MLLIILSLIATHIVEITLFAAAYFILNEIGSFGRILNASNYLDFFYYSDEVYTTLGFGDLIPEGQLRIMTGIESLIGLALITWSASFSYLKMSLLFGDK